RLYAMPRSWSTTRCTYRSCRRDSMTCWFSSSVRHCARLRSATRNRRCSRRTSTRRTGTSSVPVSPGNCPASSSSIGTGATNPSAGACSSTTVSLIGRALTFHAALPAHGHPHPAEREPPARPVGPHRLDDGHLVRLGHALLVRDLQQTEQV